VYKLVNIPKTQNDHVIQYVQDVRYNSLEEQLVWDHMKCPQFHSRKSP